MDDKYYVCYDIIKAGPEHPYFESKKREYDILTDAVSYVNELVHADWCLSVKLYWGDSLILELYN